MSIHQQQGPLSLLVRLVLASLMASFVLGCTSEVQPEQGPRAWIDIRVQSSDAVAVLEDIEVLDVIVHPLQPLVDSTGIPYLEGPVGTSGLEFVAPQEGGSYPDLRIPVDLAGAVDGFPTVALDPGVNVPLGLQLIAQGYDDEANLVAVSPWAGPLNLGEGQVLVAEIPDFELVGPPPTPTCSDSFDNDGDGWIDLDDPDCSGDPSQPEEGGFGATECNNGVDDDEDTYIDSDDPDCADGYSDDEGETFVADCADEVDNDLDGWTDLDDPGCQDLDDDNEAAASSSECNNGADDDGDGAIDAADTECTDGHDDSEAPVLAVCADGIDNDSDGWIDQADPDCLIAPFDELGYPSVQ